MSRTLLLVLLVAFSLVACGNKGPLVLPDQAPKPAPAQQTKDKAPPATPQPASGGDAANKN